MQEEIPYKEDYKLADEFLCGNKESGEKLYSEPFKMLGGFIYKFTKNSILEEEDQKEIFNETLYESIDKLDRYNGKSKFTTFVMGIAKNKCREKIRQKSNNKIVAFDDEKLFEETLEIYNRNPLDILIEKEKIERINLAMSKISLEDSQILQLRITNNMTAKEISNLTGENIEAIYSRYRRAVQRFKENYEKV